ncbi:MAG: hypothetical protein A3E01_15910 [Gammaproteobacteria bacterium RIFCSPHIGHO2_12_FULL_63_22]|nr:MAG: hypothetical protein A3E01_15910 [Gammaproteobacteria bacterium RIFCSPHIGHO2_12_FULL_63_22]
MTIAFVTRTLVPIALLALLAACERPHGPPPPKAESANPASQPAPSTVALSGTILDPQPNPAAARPPTPATRASAAAAAGTGASGSTAGYASGSADDRYSGDGADPQALRDFQAEQERRDREMLDQDLSEAQMRARDEAWDRERANAALDETEIAPPEDSNGGREAYDLPREDGDWSPSDELAPDDEALIDEPPFDEPPYEDDPELDDGYDPREGAYRP